MSSQTLARLAVIHRVAPVSWHAMRPRGDESARWESSDGRWLTVALGRDADIGSIVVQRSDGQRLRVDSYEGALALARAWRF